jgi:ATP-dependent DNA helicase RecQ
MALSARASSPASRRHHPAQIHHPALVDLRARRSTPGAAGAGVRCRQLPPGGAWAKIDPLAKGRVQILPVGHDARTQAVAVLGELQRLAGLSTGWDWARCAVIAREWQWLQPLRSFCELHGIPVQMAREESAQFWRQRDTQWLLDWLYDDAHSLVNGPAIAAGLAGRPASPVRAMLDEAAAEYTRETGGADLPREHFIEWLAEWGREARRRQSGLLLLTAHRAKGLEFDHVAVLDGGWLTGRDRQDGGAELDAERRLYYVAITRARLTLLLARFDRGQRLLDQLPAETSLLRRTASELPPPAPELSWCYQQLNPGEVDLGFAGRQAPARPVHRAIAALAPGTVLHLQQEGRRWLLCDGQGNPVGRLTASYTPPAGMDCIAARVAAIIVRDRADSEPEYRARVRCQRWEVVLPELVFAPAIREA